MKSAREFAKEALADLDRDRNSDLTDIEVLERYFAKVIAEERKACAEYIKSWGNKPPRPGGQRARLAADILARGGK